MSSAVNRLWSEETGAELTEYSLVIGVVALGAMGVLTVFRDAVTGVFNDIVAQLNALVP